MRLEPVRFSKELFYEFQELFFLMSQTSFKKNGWGGGGDGKGSDYSSTANS